ncbi:hypothetical protein AB0F46_17010 [Streptomyces sp. NPDC026665]|uniref:hypothetical protein n=1 Tax=Streptomyces sp. NPDC026665 TaxID=3154798 RepID=UPI003407A467
MPRRRPSTLRAHSRRFAPRRRFSKIGRLSGSVRADIIWLERTRLEPGMVELALTRWAAIARAPVNQLPSPFTDRCGVTDCCPEPADERDLLELVVRALPKKSSREFRGILRPLDLKILERPDTGSYGNPPHLWWRNAFPLDRAFRGDQQ